MNDPISWDPSLVKKYSSSNHHKLLNQLKNEVIKYPLNNKKKTSSTHSKDSNLDNKIKSNLAQIENSSFLNTSNHRNKDNSSQSTVSFNNSKNFSIYNQSANKDITVQNECLLVDQSISREESTNPNL